MERLLDARPRGAARDRRPPADRRRARRGRRHRRREVSRAAARRRRCTGRISTQLSPHDEVKFVIADRADFDYASDVVVRHDLASARGGRAVLAGPRRARARRARAVDSRRAASPARLQLQAHKYIWSPGARGVVMARPCGRPAVRRARFDDGRGAGAARGLGAVRSDGALRPGPRARDRRRAPRRRVARLRQARRARRRSRARSAARRSSATARSRQDRASTRPRLAHSRPPTCPRATPSFCRWRWPGPRSLGAERIVIGVNALDYSGYPDCRPEFIAAFEYLAPLATQAGVEGRRAAHLGAAAAPDQGRHHPGRPRARRRLRPDAQLLRPRAGRAAVRPLRQLPAPGARVRRSRRGRSRCCLLAPEPSENSRLAVARPLREQFAVATLAAAGPGRRRHDLGCRDVRTATQVDAARRRKRPRLAHVDRRAHQDDRQHRRSRRSNEFLDAHLTLPTGAERHDHRRRAGRRSPACEHDDAAERRGADQRAPRRADARTRPGP